MINKINIKGLKCFNDVELTLKNLTLLAGKNSMGKSTVIQAILALIQNGNNPFSGEYINIGKISELKNRYVGSTEIQISINDKFSKIIIDDYSKVKTKGKKEKLNIKYLCADRIGVRDTYSKELSNSDDIGVKCEYAYQYLEKHSDDKWEDSEFVYNPKSKLTFGGQVDYWLNEIVGYTIRAEEIDRTELIRVSFNANGLVNNIRPKNVGTGVSYIAEIIIAALSCEAGDIVIIENPEIHIHPSGQSKFVSFLAFLAQNGVQVIVETHSDHIYNSVRKSIHNDEIECDNVSIYLFEQISDGTSRPFLIPINEDGKAEQQREGFFDQTKKDLEEILGW